VAFAGKTPGRAERRGAARPGAVRCSYTAAVIVGLLHPGAMGAAIGAQLTGAGHEVRWVAGGRSARTARRAAGAGLRETGSLAELARGSDVVLSVCPPAAAEEVARAVAGTGFTGVFVEGNAISPHCTLAVAEEVAAAGATVVDGSVIGPPPGAGRTARFYLCGPGAAVDLVRGLFTGTQVRAVRVEGPLGQASALKIAYGSFQKTSRALAAVSHALADAYGVTDHLLEEARTLGRNALADRAAFPGVAARAWRWGPEMLEGAETFAAAGLPPELARAASAVLARWDGDRDDTGLDPATALDHLRDG
jgi:3-hydroxyisobutyrate dehydrogenase-like beta-hydroxyacid dehydrogenase